MKKDLIFIPVLLIISAVLSLLKATGMTAHIIVSVVGVAALIAYAVLAKKEWKLPALEILMRVFYALALISGIVLLKVQDVAALAIGHKVCATAFLLVLLVLFVHKLVTNKKA